MQITFTVDNFDEATMLATAKELGYQEMVPTTEEKTAEVTYKDVKDGTVETLLEAGARNIRFQEGHGLEDTSPVTVIYEVETMVTNPQTVKEFFKDLFVRRFLKEVVAPATVRAKTKELEEQAQQAREQAQQEVDGMVVVNVQ